MKKLRGITTEYSEIRFVDNLSLFSKLNKAPIKYVLNQLCPSLVPCDSNNFQKQVKLKEMFINMASTDRKAFE